MGQKIIFYAPVGNGVPEYMLGGGEKGCKRTREILLSAGYDVFTIDKPVMGRGLKTYISMAIKDYFSLLKQLISKKDAVLYVVGFYEKNVYLEWLNIATGKLFGHKTIYEARNGRLVTAYREYGSLYRKIMKEILRKADLVFAQGRDYIPFVKNLVGKDAVYTPNYVLNRNLLPYNENRPMDEIRLIYFGRVSEAKNVDVVLDTVSELRKKNINTKAVIIGAYTDEYKEKLDRIVETARLEGRVTFTGQQNFDVIRDELQQSHFFIFPSQEKKEGHSNSLTEAMTFGVVPIVSNAGFNASIVEKRELVLEDIKATNFADIIEKIVNENTWREYSLFMYDRIKKNYTEDRVKASILSAIDSLATP